MDLQFQQIMQRRPNRSPTPPQQNRSPNVQRIPPFPPPRQQNPQYNQPQNQYQKFDQSHRQPRTFHQNQGDFQQQQFQRFPKPFQTNQNWRNQNYDQTPRQDYASDEFQPRQRQPRQYQPPGQRFQSDQRPDRRQNFQNDQRVQQQPRVVPNQNGRQQKMGTRNQFQNMSQDQMMNSMNQFFKNQFHQNQNQFRGRGRGRGNFARDQTQQRQKNQHQRPYPSDLDSDVNKERLQKFKPNPTKKQPQKKPTSFIKQDQDSQSPSVRQQSQASYYSDEEDQYSDEGDYSQESGENDQQEEGSYVSNEGSDQPEDQQEEHPSEKEQVRSEIGKGPQITSMTQISTGVINDMCSKEQFEERLNTFDSNNRDVTTHARLKLDTSRSFSIFQINKRTLKPDYALTLKRFKRSANRDGDEANKEDNSESRRSVKALVKVINHIHKEIIDADHMRQKDLAFPLPPNEPAFEFIHIYDFLWDRMREMIKDITRLSFAEKSTKEVITICENIARFFILSINEGRKKYNSKLKFSERMNTESIIKVLSSLMEVYRQSRMNLKSMIQNLSEEERQNLTFEKIQALMHLKKIYISPYQPELSAYCFLFSDNRKKELYQIMTKGFEEQSTQSDNPLINSKEMKKALQVHRILNEKNIEKYFDKIQQDDTDYIFACIMLKHLQRLRKDASVLLFTTHNFDKDGSRQGFVKKAILTESLQQTLRFPATQAEEFSDFLDQIGAQQEGKIVVLKQKPYYQDSESIPEYIFGRDKTQRRPDYESQPKKYLKEADKLSREELIKCSWKKSTYREQIINFYLGSELEVSKVVEIPKKVIKISQQKKLSQIPEQSQTSKEKQSQAFVNESQRKDNNLSTLKQMRNQLQKKSKRSKFLEKVQAGIYELYRHTDQAKIINRKKALGLLDEWMVYYQQKMLAISFNKLRSETAKKNLLTNVLKQIKTFSSLKKKFNATYSKSPFEFHPISHQNTLPQRTGKGLMSSLLQKAHLKAKKACFDSFEQYLNERGNKMQGSDLNILVLTTCSDSNQNNHILEDLLLYLVYQKSANKTEQIDRIRQSIERVHKKEKQVPLIKVYFESKNLILKVRIARINDLKNKRKAFSQNSHIIQYLFGCNGLFILRENGKQHATHHVLNYLQEFAKINMTNHDEEEKRVNISHQNKVHMPILLVNIIKKPFGFEETRGSIMNKTSFEKYRCLTNLNELQVVEESTQPLNLPYIANWQLQKQVDSIRQYLAAISEAASAFCQQSLPILYQSLPMTFDRHSRQVGFQVKSLKQILREIRINSSLIEEKLASLQQDKYSELRKKFIFSFYQEYFNLCVEQVAAESSKCYKHSVYVKKWAKYMLMVQNILTEKDFIKPHKIYDSNSIESISEGEEDLLISNTLETQNNYNLILESFKEHQFTAKICQDLQMKFVGQHTSALEIKYLIFDEEGLNAFGMPKISRNLKQRQEKENILYLTHFINTIGKYLNLFDPKRTVTDNKFQSLFSVFQQYGLQLKTFDYSGVQSKGDELQEQTKIDYQVEGNSLEFFNYLIGYLMEGCIHVNILLPRSFKFRLNFQEFLRKSMRNLQKAIRAINYKKKDVFENLKHEKSLELQMLVQGSTFGLQGQSIQKEEKKLEAINCDSDMGQNEDEAAREIKFRGLKRNLSYHYRTVYSSEFERPGFNQARLKVLNQLRKVVKI